MSPLHSFNLWVNLSCRASPLKVFDLDLVSFFVLSQWAFRTTSCCTQFSVFLVAVLEEIQHGSTSSLHISCLHNNSSIRVSVLEPFRISNLYVCFLFSFISHWLFFSLSIFSFKWDRFSLTLYCAIPSPFTCPFTRTLDKKAKDFFLPATLTLWMAMSVSQPSPLGTFGPY